MKAGWETKTLGEILQKTETINPLLTPDAEFDYIDVSRVSNTTFEIEETQRLKGQDAPSRARKMVRIFSTNSSKPASFDRPSQMIRLNFSAWYVAASSASLASGRSYNPQLVATSAFA